MRRLILGSVLLVLLTACGGSPSSAGDSAGVAAAPSMAAAGMAYDSAPAQPASEAQPVDSETQRQTVPDTQTTTDRLVIRTARLQLLVADVGQVEAQVRALAEQQGGFVLNAQSAGDGDNRSASVTIKVPAERFNDAVTMITGLALKVESQTVQGQDVTDEFVDLQARVNNLRAVEARLLDFLARAQKTDDLLTINGQLSDIQGQIEQAQGRINYLRQSNALSTIEVVLRPNVVVVSSVVPEEGWSPVAIARASLRNLIGFGQAIATVAIVFGVWAPVWLPLLLIGLWLRRRSRRAAYAPPTS